MGHVNVTIAGRAFRMACADGEEERLTALAADIDERIAQMRADFGEIGDNRLTVMAAISVADELFEARRANDALRQRIADLERAGEAARARENEAARAVAQAIDAISERLDEMANALNAEGRRSP